LCMIGGKKFDPNNRFNYAMQARRQPGSSFKPFVYSAALDSGLYTPATVFIDKPYVFTFDSDDPDDWYKPNNYGGAYYGKVSFRRALRKSLNIPACEIFYTIGRNNDYKVPIDRAAIMLGLISQKDINERFKREVSTVLGTGSVSPVEMARGFSVFANMGQKRVPNAVISVEDRDGRTIYEPWKELQKYYRENAKKLQVISEQNAYVMTDIMKDTVAHPDGMLYYRKRRMIAAGKNFPDVEIAAKTGTTQNFCDGWTVGYSPEITVAMWCGFKEYGLSLGNNQPGVTIHGNSFLDFMRVYHYNKGPMKFTEPDGIVHAKICPESGLLPSESCNEDNLIEEIFIKGTEPTRECTVCMLKGEQRHSTLDKFIDKYEMTRRPETQLFRGKVGYNKDIMRSAAKAERDQNELSDVTLDIEGLNTVDLFEDDTYIDVDALLGTNKKKSNRTGRSSSGRTSSQNGSSNQSGRSRSSGRGRRSRGSSTTTTTVYDMYQDPYEADAATDNEPEVDLDLNLDALLNEDFGDMLLTNDDDQNANPAGDDILTDNPVQDDTSDMINGNNDLGIPNNTIVPSEENAPADNAGNIGEMPTAAEPSAQDEDGAAEPSLPDDNNAQTAEPEQDQPEAVPADNAEGEVKSEQNNANNEDFFLDL
ncbi:MAG: hypothetical protein IKQ61_11220, partial [Spirochaetales bacterium]|nr:hypothetical protein [Spirochaetales bacterium]